jgi:hypothetical protein
MWEIAKKYVSPDKQVISTCAAESTEEEGQ